MNILISRCLLGEPCRYDGAEKYCAAAEQLREAGHRLIPVCPEVDGGLPTPRPPAEVQQDRRVVNRDGVDVTQPYRKGAELALEMALQHHCGAAVLKANSPSCGNRTIYDGTFTRTLIPGQGLTAERLSDAGIKVVNETEIESLLHWLERESNKRNDT